MLAGASKSWRPKHLEDKRVRITGLRTWWPQHVSKEAFQKSHWEQVDLWNTLFLATGSIFVFTYKCATQESVNQVIMHMIMETAAADHSGCEPFRSARTNIELAADNIQFTCYICPFKPVYREGWLSWQRQYVRSCTMFNLSFAKFITEL